MCCRSERTVLHFRKGSVWLAQGHIANKWQISGKDMGLSNLRLVLIFPNLLCSECLLPETCWRGNSQVQQKTEKILVKCYHFHDQIMNWEANFTFQNVSIPSSIHFPSQNTLTSYWKWLQSEMLIIFPYKPIESSISVKAWSPVLSLSSLQRAPHSRSGHPPPPPHPPDKSWNTQKRKALRGVSFILLN